MQSSIGDVSVAAAGAGDWKSLDTGSILTAPFAIKTGTTGQAILVRGDDSLLIASKSEIQVQAARDSGAGLITHIMQSIGSLVYQVEKRAQQRFEVETPYLVSVVKGTTFTISVSAREAVVSLEEGSLEVFSKDGSHSALMKPGEIARSAQGLRGFEISRAVMQRSQWGRWHPANLKQDARGASTRSGADDVARAKVRTYTLHGPGQGGSDSSMSDTAPGLSGAPPGLSRTTPGLSNSAPGLSRTTPGLSGSAPGLSRTTPGLSNSAPGLSRTTPGLSGSAPGLSRTTPGLSGSPPGLSRIPPGLNK